MTIIPPVAGINVGQSTGGGLLDTFKQAIGGATGQAATQAPTTSSGDGSVGLFDGVLKKALFGGAAGAAMGFLPFIPGGPILGGVVGALGGAAMGVFSNWQKQKQIKAENEAMLAAMGVQVNDPAIQEVLKSGNVSQLIPMMQSAQQTGTQTGVQTGVQTSSGTNFAAAAAGQTPVSQSSTVDPATGVDYGDVTQAEIEAMQQRAIAEGKTPGQVVPVTQSVMPIQATGSGGGGAINPALGVNPGVAPALAGGGGAAGDAGRPAAPAGVNSSDATAIAPQQAGIGMATTGASDAAAGTQELEAAKATNAQLLAMIQKLDQQIQMLKAIIASNEADDLQQQAA